MAIDIVRPFAGFDYVYASNPTIDVNPGFAGLSWCNMATGEIFICTDVTVDNNVWVGQLGTTVQPV